MSRATAFRPSPLAAEAYVPPSSEARRLVRRAAWLTSPAQGRAGWASALWLQMLIAPMTQLTFLSFDLQAFLFLVFHRRKLSVLGHATFMTTEHLFIMATLRGWPLVPGVDSGLIYAVAVLVWYASVALGARLVGWFAATVLIVIGLYFASEPIAAVFERELHVSPAWGVLLSGALIALSHASEPLLPPRTIDPWHWVCTKSFVGSPSAGLRPWLIRVARLAWLFAIGTVAESWAALRLLHYNWLFAMMRLGYAPARYAELTDWADRAWATGQPALDFVGTGGGTFLASHDA